MHIYKVLLVFLASLALAGCSSKHWDWFFDDEEEEVVYEEDIVDEEFEDEEYAEGEGKGDDEYEYEYEYEYEDEYDDQEPSPRGNGQGGVSRYGDEPRYREKQEPSRQAEGRTPGRTAIYFDYKKETVPANGLNLLQLHAQFLKANPGAVVTVEGHTDSVASAEYNERLGLRRAETVADLLIDMGVSAPQIVTVSYGEERPANDGSDKKAQALNRRVELAY